MVVDKNDVLTVSTNAVAKDGKENTQYVYKVENDKLVKTTVETGDEGDSTVEITSGLKEGDQIIFSNSEDIKDGMTLEEFKKTQWKNNRKLKTAKVIMEGTRTMIKVSNLKKCYSQGELEVQALAGVDLEVKKGEFVSIMGSSGSGKSTLMNILGCLDKPTSGDYILDGINISKVKDSQLSQIRNKKSWLRFPKF